MKNANPGQQRKSTRQVDLGCEGESRRREPGLTPPLRRSDLIPKTGVVGAITLVIARAKHSQSSDGMVYLGTDRNTESQEQRVNDT